MLTHPSRPAWRRAYGRSLWISLCLIAWAVSAQAQTVHAISGTAQFAIGSNLYIPHPLFGGAWATPNAHGPVCLVTAFTPAGGILCGASTLAVLPPSGPPDNTLWSFGGPWTAGNLTVSVMANLGAPPFSVFMLQGSDNRSAGGNGNVTLVSGASATAV